MTLHQIAQRIDEWKALRCGRVTGTMLGQGLATVGTDDRQGARRQLQLRRRYRRSRLMTRSEQINELAAALAKAQGQIKGAMKDSANPFFKSKYADLASVWEAFRQALSTNGLSVRQSPQLLSPSQPDGPYIVMVQTLLMHTSGQWVQDTAATPIEKMDAQGVGSATTYLRRYALAAFVGVAPEDDDGNAAVGAVAQ